MNFELIGKLIRLRYKLMWARTRTRNGKIAWFMAGYIFVILAGVVLAVGGVGAGWAAVNSGKAEPLAQGVLTGLFLSAFATSLMLGFGMNAVFSDVELRRYPLRAQERFVARHLTGAVDPFWFLFVMLEGGLAVGLYLFGVAPLALGAVAVALLFLCNYLAAQTAAAVMDRMMQNKGGSILLPLIFMAICILPGMLTPVFVKKPDMLEPLVKALGFSPPFAAGTLMVRTGMPALRAFALLALWIAGLAMALALLERLPRAALVTRQSRVKWDSPFARIGALFGPKHGPMVAHWLQFYSRCRRFRLTYLMSVPLVPFLLLFWTRQGPRSNQFASALGVFAMAGAAPALGFIVNQFGYLGGGFRRHLLLPIDAGAALRASSYALMAACVAVLIPAAIVWVLFAPVPITVQGMAMLLASGVFGLFAFQGAGLWTTLFAPRRSDPNHTMGNDLSLPANFVVIGGMLPLLMGPQLIGQRYKDILTPDHWWVAVLLAALAFGFYTLSLRRATAILHSRREQLLSVVEGKAS